MPVLLIFVLAVAVLDLLFGFIKGARKTIVGIATIVLSAAISLLVTPAILGAVLTGENVNIIVEALNFAETYNELVAASPSVEELLLGLPTAILGPVIFLVLYFILRTILRIVLGIVSKIIYPKKNNIKSRLLGLGLGFVQGLLSSMVIVAIVAGLALTLNNVTDTILSQDAEVLTEVKESVVPVDESVNLLAEDPVAKMLDGGNFVYDTLTSFKFNEEKVVLGEEITSIVEAGVYLVPVMENSEMANWSDAEFAALNGFVDRFGNSKLLPQISAEVLASACEKWGSGEPFMGIEAPKVDETIDPLLVALFTSLKASNAETIVVDMGTLVDVLEVLDKHEIFSKLGDNSEDILSYLNGQFVSDFLLVISNNERFTVLVPEITNLSMRMLASALKLPQNTEEIYSKVTEGLSSSLSEALSSGEEVNVEEFTKNVTSTLKENGIEVSDEVAGIVAESIVNAFEGKESVSSDDIQKYFEDYAKIYGEFQNGNSESASTGGVVNLGASKGNAGVIGAIDYESMTFEEKLAELAEIGVLDYCSKNNDLSSRDNVLNNGMTADMYVNYMIRIYNSICKNYEAINALGSVDENPILALKSSETIITNKMTAEDLMVESGNYNISEQEISNIANGFGSITSFLTSLNAVEGSVSLENISELDLEAAGAALDSLKNTELLGNKVGKVADVLVSEVVGSDISISDNDVSFESLMTTVKSTSNVLANMSKENCTEEEKEAAIVDLLLNLTEETSGVVSEIVTEEFMVQQGVPSQYASASAQALKIALIEMAKLPENEHDVEAAKLKYFFEIASATGSSKTIIGENGIFKSEEEIIDMMLSSKVVYITVKTVSTDENGTMVVDALGIAKSLSDNDKASLENAIKNYYENNKSTDTTGELTEKLNLAGLLFGLESVIK